MTFSEGFAFNLMLKTPGSAADPDQGKAQYVRYARSIRIRISLRYQTEGQITPPVMYITYGQVSLTDANEGVKVPVSYPFLNNLSLWIIIVTS